MGNYLQKKIILTVKKYNCYQLYFFSVRIENGIRKSYYENGQLCSEVNYIDGEKI